MTVPAFKGGSYAVGERLLSSQVNPVNAKLPYLLDGEVGGEVSPTGLIEVNGQGLSSKPIMAWIEPNPVSKTTAQSFELTLQASVYRVTSWTLVTSTDLEVPQDGWYSITGAITVNPSESEEANLIAIRVGSSEIGQFDGRNYSGSGVRCTGGVIVPIFGDLTAQRISFRPLTATMTPNDTTVSPAGSRQLILVKYEGMIG